MSAPDLARVGQPPRQPTLGQAVRGLVARWLAEKRIAQDDAAPSAFEQAIVLVLDEYQAQTDARLAALEQRNRTIITKI